MPTHFIHYGDGHGDASQVFHTDPEVTYRLRNALLAAGAVDPEASVAGDLIHFTELFSDQVPHHVLPENILETVRAWKGRIPGLEVHPPRGLSEGERTTLAATMPRPRSGRLVERALPEIDGDELASSFIDWAERAALEGGGFIVLP